MNWKEILNDLRKRGFKPKKSWGQNFLIDRSIVDFILEASFPDGKNVLEVGGGFGVLSFPLSEKVSKLVVVEKDPLLFGFLKDLFVNSKNVTVLEADILALDLNLIFGGESYTIVSNLPYSISSPFLFKLWDENPAVTEAVLMLQYEVAMRLLGKGKENRCPLWVIYSLTHDVSILRKVPRNSFVPKPEVDSAIVKLVKKKEIDTSLREILRIVVDSAFRYRRKKIERALLIEYPEIKWGSILGDVGISGEARAEDLTPVDWFNIANTLVCLVKEKKVKFYKTLGVRYGDRRKNKGAL